MFNRVKLMASSAFVALSTSVATASPIEVNLDDATASVTNAGTALIGIAVLILGIMLVIRFLRKG